MHDHSKTESLAADRCFGDRTFGSAAVLDGLTVQDQGFP